jgi:N6-L-threonylcarbamoyladenine synthase
MLILAFETSCDDTAVAIVRNGTEVLSNIRLSQPEHNQYGGVVPEIAARLHADNWKNVLEEAFVQANKYLNNPTEQNNIYPPDKKEMKEVLYIEDIDAIAVTQGPGLQTALLTGTSAASYLSHLYQKPIIPVHHILGHLSSTALDRSADETKFPNLVLTVSGGHTSLYYRTSFVDVQQIGKTLDDAAGEAFDKCAKMLGLGYPGGPIVSQWAEKGDRKAYKFPCIMLDKSSLDFSFSGLKASVYRLVEEHKKNAEAEKIGPFDETFIANVCASFETIVSTILTKKILRALEHFPQAKELHFVGGVSANTFIRKNLEIALNPKSVELFVPIKMSYCTDNAAMIGVAGYFLAKDKKENIHRPSIIEANSRLKL